MKSEKSNHINMIKSDLEKLSKSELIKLLLKQEKKKPEIIIVDDTKPVPTPRTYKPRPPILTPREFLSRWFKIMKTTYQNTNQDHQCQHQELRNWLLKKPVPLPRTVKPEVSITLNKTAIKGSTKSYKVSIYENLINKDGLIDPIIQLMKSRLPTTQIISEELKQMKGPKFNQTLKVTFTKNLDYNDKDKYQEMVFDQKKGTTYFKSKAQTIINNTEITRALEESEEDIKNKIDKWISEGSGWRVKSVNNHYLNIAKYKPMNGSSYIKLPSELHKKGLINIKNEDNECFRWCHIRHLNPQEKNPQRIKKSDKEYVDKLDYSGVKFPVTIKQFNKIEKQNKINISVFGYEDKQPYPIYVSKEKYEDHIELLLVTKDENKHYVLIKDFDKFMFNQTIHEYRKHFCMYCLQCFSSERVLNNHKENCIQVNGTQAIKMPTKDNNILKFNNFHKQQQQQQQQQLYLVLRC